MSGFVSDLRNLAAQGASELAASSEAFVRRRKLDAVCTDEDKTAPGAFVGPKPRSDALTTNNPRPRRIPTASVLTAPRRPPSPPPKKPRVPPPAYLLDELVASMRAMPPDALEDCAEHLARRCEHRSPVVKLKALRAIKYLCAARAADGRFARLMSRRSGRVRACATHSGPPDEFRGDAPHRAVRAMAEEAMAAIHGDDRPSPIAATREDAAAAGSSPSAAPIIGDASANPPRLNKTSGTWGPERETAPNPSEGVDEPNQTSTSQLHRRLSSGASDLLSAAAVASVDALASPTPGTAALASPPKVTTSSPSFRNNALSSGASVKIPAAAPQSPTNNALSAAANAPFALAGSEELRRVDATCARGGFKLAPSPERLRDFVAACECLHHPGVVRALSAKLRMGAAGETDDAWKEAYKAACCLEYAAERRASEEGARRLVRAFGESNELFEALGHAAGSNAGNGKLAEKAEAARRAIAAARAEARGGEEKRADPNAANTSEALDFFAAAPAPSGAPPDLLGGGSPGGGGLTGLFGGAGASDQQTRQMQQMQLQMMGMGMGMGGAPGAGTGTGTGMGMAQPGMGMAQPGMGMPPPGMGMGMTPPGMGMPPPGMGMGMGMASPGTGMPAASPGLGIRVGTPPSAGIGGRAAPLSPKSPSSPTAINGGQSAYTQQKDSKAFDFVNDMLAGRK